jgi:hypothetical protein
MMEGLPVIQVSYLSSGFRRSGSIRKSLSRMFVSAVTSVAYQSFSGDHVKMWRWPDVLFAAKCSKLTGRHFRVCQLATSPVIRTPVRAVKSTTCQSCTGDQ